MSCSHESCNHEENIWLPRENNLGSDVALHPWCLHCGLVKNISDDRPKKIGYWMNILSKLSYRFSIPQCQRRLIALELNTSEEFTDLYGITGSAQKEFFTNIVKKYYSICRNEIYSFCC